MSSLSLTDARAEGRPATEVSVETVGAMLEVGPSTIQRARTSLTLLGDGGRRTIVEQLALRPQAPADSLPRTTGMGSPDLYHRLRSLHRNGVVARDRSHVYSVDPEALRCLSRYFDSLMVAASLTSAASGGASR